MGRVDWPRVFKAIGWFFGGVAAVIAMSLALGNHHDDQRTIREQSTNIDRLQTQVDRLQNQVDSNSAVSDCRARLGLEVTLRTAGQVQAIGQLVVVIAKEPDRVDQAVADITAATGALSAAIAQRQTFERDTTQPCPVPATSPPNSDAVTPPSTTTTTTPTPTTTPRRASRAVKPTTTTTRASTTTSTVYPSPQDQPSLCARLLGPLNPGVICPVGAP